jgi:peptide/nickel transport system substrate-binding protein
MRTNALGRWLQRASVAVAVAASSALVLSACGGGDTDGSGGKKPTLTIALASSPTSLDPSKGSGGPNQTFQLPAYSTLLHIAELGGKPQPGLAEAWKWLDQSNQRLQITLHPGLKFSDGTVLDAAAVKTSIEHFAKGGSSWSYVALPIKSIEANDLTVVFNLSHPSPTFPNDLAEGPGMGSIISPAVLASAPDSLGTTTAGAGPYMLSKDGTVEGSEYHYAPNPKYHDPKAVLYSAVTIKVIADPKTALASLQAGQLDVAYGYPDTYKNAKSGGVKAAVYNTALNGLWLQDWSGDLIPALGDERVRRAINFAIDRKAIAQAVTQGLGDPTTQTPLPGTLGYDKALEDTYQYDPNQARKLLAQAGYSNGFTLPIIVPSFIPTSAALGQALAAQFAKVGIKVNITSASTFPEFAQTSGTGKFGGIVVPLPMASGVPSAMDNVFSPQALVNTRHGKLPAVLAAVADASALSGDAAEEAWQKVNATLVNGAYTAPVMTEPVIFYYTDKVASLGRVGDLNPVFVQPSS